MNRRTDPNLAAHAATDAFSQEWKNHLDDLKSLIRIPSVSFSGFDPKHVTRCAHAVQEVIRKSGLQDVRLIEFSGAPPYVYAQSEQRPDRPTVLLYAHYDVQPPGRDELWKSQAFEPTERPGPGGMRLYGRGAADDKAGVIVHTAAIASYLRSGGDLPVNVKLLIEGEEETGSAHLADFLKQHHELVQADYLVLTDTTNFDVGVPGLTVGLRGLVKIDVEVRGLKQPVHSGLWGGPLPDPAIALAKILAGMMDDSGKILIPGIDEATPKLSAEEINELAELTLDEPLFREQAGLVNGGRMIKQGPSVWAQLWRLPALSVNAIQASSRAQAGNIIVDTAWAKVSMRIAPGMSASVVEKCMHDYFQKAVPWGLEIQVKTDAAAEGWKMDPRDPKVSHGFQAGAHALEKAYGKKPVFMGCGASIPFVKPFVEALGGVPALLVGVEDPYTAAHGENESVLVEDLRKACLGQVYLFEELGILGVRGGERS